MVRFKMLGMGSAHNGWLQEASSVLDTASSPLATTATRWGAGRHAQLQQQAQLQRRPVEKRTTAGRGSMGQPVPIEIVAAVVLMPAAAEAPMPAAAIRGMRTAGGHDGSKRNRPRAMEKCGRASRKSRRATIGSCRVLFATMYRGQSW